MSRNDPADSTASRRDLGPVSATSLREGDDFGLIVQPDEGNPRLQDWAPANRELVTELLRDHAVILFRGFNDIRSPEEFERFIRGTSDGEPLSYTYGSTPRDSVQGKIYTTTVYPQDRAIPLHNEMSYTRSWPMILWLCCETPAATGGETPVADSRRVLRRISPEVVNAFRLRGVQYVRNYSDLIDVPWQKVFLTEDRSEVEELCRKKGVELEWTARDGLRTRQVCQALAMHPETSEEVWFNQAHLWHISNLPIQDRNRLEKIFRPEDLPRNAYFGDGSTIDDWMLEDVRKAYEQEKVVFPWERGDLVMVDNMLAAHAREPFTGERMIWIGMAEEHSPGTGEL